MPNHVEIVFQNSHFVAVVKPAMTLSVRSREGKKDPRPVLWDLLESQLKTKVGAIHRLDFEVSGLMLWALTPDAQAAGNTAFEKNQVLKTYLAETEDLGKESAPTGWTEWRSKLLRGKKRTYESEHGKSAITKAHMVGNNGGSLQWNLQPITGRSHQLRYELYKRGFPICGDSLYGAQLKRATEGIALQAAVLKITGENLLNKFGLPAQLQLSDDAKLFANS